MRLSINRLVEQSICELSKEQEVKVRKFIARYRGIAIMKNVSKDNLLKSIIYRNNFLAEIDNRYLRGDMQFLSARVYGYIRAYIKWIANDYMKTYIVLKKNLVLM